MPIDFGIVRRLAVIVALVLMAAACAPLAPRAEPATADSPLAREQQAGGGGGGM